MGAKVIEYKTGNKFFETAATTIALKITFMNY